MDWIEADELAIAVLGLDEDADSDVVEQEMADRFEISMESFRSIAEALLKLTPPSTAAVTGTKYHGFVKDGVFVVKEEING
jgi:hypothetical protein